MLKNKSSKINSNGCVIYNKTQTTSDQKFEKQISYKDHCSGDNKMIISEAHIKNCYYNMKMDPYINNDIKSTILKETNVINLLAKHIKTESTLKKENDKKSQKNSTSTELTLTIPQGRILRSMHTKHRTLNKYEKNMFNPLIESCNSKTKLNKIKKSHVTKVNHRRMKKHDLPASTHFDNKPTIYCDSCNYTLFCNKMLEKHCNTASGKSDIVSQCTCPHSFKTKPSQKKSTKMQTYESAGQSASETNVQTLIDSKRKTECYISMKKKGKKEYKINKSINIEESKKIIHRRGEKQTTTELACHFEINKGRQPNLNHAREKYKQHTNKIVRNKCFKRTLGKESTNNFSKNTILESNTNDIKIKKEMVMSKNCPDTKQLIVPLIKLEDLPLSELSTLIYTPTNVDSKPKKQENNICQTKNIPKVYKQYKTSKLETNEEIHVLHRTCNLETNIVKQLNRNLTNIKFETNKYEVSSENEVDNTKMLQSTKPKLQNTHLLQNILQFFTRYKSNMTKRKRKPKSKLTISKNFHKYGVRKSVAMCVKCKEVFSLLQQFSDRTNFLKDEKLCIECTLCSLQINSLSYFQQHVMDVHLQCERKSLTTKKKFTVEIVTFDVQLNLNNNDKIIFECCCCSKVFNHITHFEEHINKMHNVINNFVDSITNCTAKQEIETSELCKTYKNEETFNKKQVSNKNLIFDITTNMTEISNQEEEYEVQSSNHMNEYYMNTKRINSEDNIYHSKSNNNNVSLKMEVKKEQTINIKQLSVTQITKPISNMEEHMADLNVDERCSNLNNILKIPLISGQHSNTPNSKFNPRYKKIQNTKRKNYFPYICNICFKKYKREYTFLSHMSKKHGTNSNTNIYKEQNAQEIVKDGNVIKFGNDLTVSNIYNKYFQDCTNNPKTLTVKLEEANQSSLISEIIDEGMNNVKYENKVNVMKKGNIVLETDEDYNYICHINLTQNSGKPIKRQKSMKFNINVTKRYKTNTSEQQNMKSEIKSSFLIVSQEFENSFPVTTNINSTYDTNKENVVIYGSKELYCNICDKRFSSQTILKEHMFILHDSLFEDSNLSNIPVINYLNNCSKLKNLPIQNTHVFKKEHNVSSEIQISRFLHKENKMYEKPIYQICSKNNINKKSKKWRCNSCKENFALLRNYLRHKYYCHNDESVVHICDNCNKVLTSVAMVNIHMCTSVTSWNCKRCYLNFSNGISLTQHNMNYHLETVGPHVCEICKLNFLTTYMLKRHISTHSINDYNNLNNYVDSSISTENCLPYILNNINASTEFIIKETQLIVDKAVCYTNTNIENSEELNELNTTLSEMYITSNIPCNSGEILQCKLCNIFCTTKIQMKLHLENCHNLNIDICQICNELYFADELTKHLICHHIVFDNLLFRENDINIQVTYRQIAAQNNLTKMLGLKRLLSLFEYQRFDDVPQNKGFNCIICSKQFTSIQCYKIHYLQYHDMICLLCNMEFKYNFQAFEHKTKIHTSIDLYLWVVQNLTLAILQLNKYGSTIEEVILKYSETRIY